MPEPTLIQRSGIYHQLGLRVARSMASLRTTVIGLVMLGGFACLVAIGAPGGSWLLQTALVLLTLNLIAALAIAPVFRVYPALFGFHLCLLLLLVSLGFGQLMRFKGHLEVAEGQAFDPSSVIVDRVGWIKPLLPAEGAFLQQAISVAYAPVVVRRESESNVRMRDGHRGRALDGKPLVVDGYRFYLTHNKGFAAVLRWQDKNSGRVLRGTVHFPSFPRLASEQRRQWQTPGGSNLWLAIDPRRYPQDKAWRLNASMSGDRLRIRPVLGNAGDTALVAGGAPLDLPGGSLYLEGVGMWMGYRVFYDPSLPWVFASAFGSLALLFAHLWGRLAKPKARNGTAGSRTGEALP